MVGSGGPLAHVGRRGLRQYDPLTNSAPDHLRLEPQRRRRPAPVGSRPAARRVLVRRGASTWHVEPTRRHWVRAGRDDRVEDQAGVPRPAPRPGWYGGWRPPARRPSRRWIPDRTSTSPGGAGLEEAAGTDDEPLVEAGLVAVRPGRSKTTPRMPATREPGGWSRRDRCRHPRRRQSRITPVEGRELLYDVLAVHRRRLVNAARSAAASAASQLPEVLAEDFGDHGPRPYVRRAARPSDTTVAVEVREDRPARRQDFGCRRVGRRHVPLRQEHRRSPARAASGAGYRHPAPTSRASFLD